MATFNNPIISSTSLSDEEPFYGRVGFLLQRPVSGVKYEEYRPPGSLWAYYRPDDGYAELYVADVSGYRFVALR